MHLDAGQWRTLSALLDEALDVPAPDVEAWLARLPSEHAALGPLLAQMLARRDRPETAALIDGLPAFTLPDAPGGEAPLDAAPGAVVGPYRVVREIGAGGMGTVWLAERIDGLVTRPVALKLPHLVGSRAVLAERFARERAILAALDHPHIARLDDAGFAADGQPFLALEYVAGVPITDACSARGFSTRERVALFRQVVAAVEHAHARLVLHRDLKPSNILVTADGEVKLLDFGVAKLMADGSASETALTELTGRALTVDYASPEQIRGETLTTASDVYSLGVVLYELVTGRRPYRLKHGSRAELEAAILDQEVERASVAARSHGRARANAVDAELEAIIAKALDKSPAARYPTANALDEDLERYLEGRPVQARPSSALRRAARFVRRHAIAVGAGSAIAMLLATASVVSFVAMQRAERFAAEARRETTRARAVEAFLTDLFKANSLERRPGMNEPEPTASALLDRGVAQLDRTLHEAADVRAYLYRLIGGMYVDLGHQDKARVTLERAVDEARKATGPESHDTALALLNLALAQRRYRENDAAWPLVEKARSILAQVAPDSSDLAETFFVEADVFALGDPPRAIRAGEEALRRLQRNGDRPESLADVLAVLADAYRYNGQHALAIERDYAAIDAMTKLHGEKSFNAARRRLVLARSLQAQLRLEESDEMLRRVVDALRERALDGRQEIVWALVQLGQSAWLRGDIAGANRQFALARDENRAVARSTPVPPNLLDSLLAYELVYQGDDRGARSALAALVESAEPLSPAIATLNLSSLARAQLMSGDLAGAKASSAKAEARIARTPAPHVVRWRTIGTAGEVAALSADRAAALAHLAALRDLRGTEPDALMQVLDISLAEARILDALGDADGVRALLQPWIEREWKAPYALPVPAHGEALMLLGLASLAQQRSDADALLSEALTLLRRCDAEGSSRVRRVERALAAMKS